MNATKAFVQERLYYIKELEKLNIGQTPQRSDSVKKPKIKLNTSSTPKAANGTSTPKAKDESSTKVVKPKNKKAKEGGDKKAEPSKDTKMTPEERRARKEVCFPGYQPPPIT